MKTAAEQVLQAWREHCQTQTGKPSVFETPRGQYHFERSKPPRKDGVILGQVFVHAYGGLRTSGTFRIEADGTVTRGPACLKQVAKAVRMEYQHDHDSCEEDD